MKDLVIIPRVSEKAYAQSQVDGIKTYVFEVPTSANKHTIAQAVASQYDVVVTAVRITNAKGKLKHIYRKGGRPIQTTRNGMKKAYVTLREGDMLPLFIEESAEDEKQAKEAEKSLKKAAKGKK